MKKLMIAAAIACVAGLANAGAVNWGSGAIQTPGDGGALSGTKLTSSSGYSLTVYAWESLAASALSYDAGDLYSWYSSGASTTSDPFGGSLSAIAGSVSMGTSATTATAVGSEITPPEHVVPHDHRIHSRESRLPDPFDLIGVCSSFIIGITDGNGEPCRRSSVDVDPALDDQRQHMDLIRLHIVEPDTFAVPEEELLRSGIL